MSSNINLSLEKEQNKFKTYFIHIKKSEINDFDDINMIKTLLDDKLLLTNDSIQLSDFKFVNKIDLENKSYKNVGKYLKSNKSSCCVECNKVIDQQCVFKQLSCGHRFHVKCIDPKLKNDIYKKCTKCCAENITSLI